jgi:hypothetical protein
MGVAAIGLRRATLNSGDDRGPGDVVDFGGTSET